MAAAADQENDKRTLNFQLGLHENEYKHRTTKENPSIRTKSVRSFNCRKPDMRFSVDDDGKKLADFSPKKIRAINRNRRTTAERHDLHRALLLVSIFNHTLCLNEFLALIGVRRKSFLDTTVHIYKPSMQREMVLDMFFFMMFVRYGVRVARNIEDVVALATVLFPLEQVPSDATPITGDFAILTDQRVAVKFKYTDADGAKSTVVDDSLLVSCVYRRPAPADQTFRMGDVAEEELYNMIVEGKVFNSELSKADPRYVQPPPQV